MSGASAERTLGKYRLVAELGHGGMSDVHLATSVGPIGVHNLLVVKQLRADLAEDQEFLTMFLDEARLAARLSHRNVVQTYEVGIDGAKYFLAMEFLDGQALRKLVHRAKPRGLSLALHVRVVSEALAGLHHAHELRGSDGTPLGVVHRDVSPHNVFVTYAGEVKVLDFGIAKALDSSAETGAGVMKGKLAYMSPEQARGDDVDRRADLFAAGIMLWEALAARRMWEGLASSTIARRLLCGDLPKLRDCAPEAPAALVAICARSLAIEPEARFATAAEFQQALDAWLSSCGERSSLLHLGETVAALFAEDRLALHRVIEDQLSTADSPSFKRRLPHVDTCSAIATTPGGVKQPVLAAEPPNDADCISEPPGAPSSTAGLAIKDSRALGETHRTSAWHYVVVVAAVLGFALMFGVFGWHASRGHRHDAVFSQFGTLAPEALCGAPLQSAPVVLTFLARPSQAQLFLDDLALEGNPATAKVPAGTAHTLRAEANGCVPWTREVTPRESVTVDVMLEKQPQVFAARQLGSSGQSFSPPPSTGSVTLPGR